MTMWPGLLRRGSVDLFDLWRRAGVKAAALTHRAEADAFRPSLGLARREALWAIKTLRDEPLPLFAAAQATREAEEPDVLLQPMRDGAEVVRDYNRLGLTPCGIIPWSVCARIFRQGKSCPVGRRWRRRMGNVSPWRGWCWCWCWSGSDRAPPKAWCS